MDPALSRGRRVAVESFTDRSRPERSLAPGPSVAAVEIQGASAGPSQTFSAVPCRIGGSGPWQYGYPREEQLVGRMALVVASLKRFFPRSYLSSQVQWRLSILRDLEIQALDHSEVPTVLGHQREPLFDRDSRNERIKDV